MTLFRSILRPVFALAIVAVLATAAGCQLYQKDRCFVEDDVYDIAYDMFMESGSLDVVERRLLLYEWRRCEINEVVYRLEKQFEVPAP